MEMKEKNIVIRIDSVNAWAVKDLSHLYCNLFNKINEISDLGVRKELIDRCLTYLITCVQKLGKYSGVIYNNFYAEKMELETRVNQVVINIVSPNAKDFKNINLFLGVLLDGIISIENAIERHKFVVKTTEDTMEIYRQFTTYILPDQADQLVRLAR